VALKTVKVSGALTMNGAPMPDNTLSPSYRRGTIVLTNRDTGTTASISAGPTGASYTGTLFAGTYDVDFTGYDEGYQNVVPSQRARLRRGCFQIPSCTIPKTDISGSWSMQLDATQSNAFFLSLAQQGGQLTGTYSYVSDQGSLTGTRSGDDVTMKFQTYACQVTLTGTVASGCLMTGAVSLAGSCYSWDPRSFFARR
jgi:hypothetical protein